MVVSCITERDFSFARSGPPCVWPVGGDFGWAYCRPPCWKDGPRGDTFSTLSGWGWAARVQGPTGRCTMHSSQARWPLEGHASRRFCAPGALSRWCGVAQFHATDPFSPSPQMVHPFLRRGGGGHGTVLLPIFGDWDKGQNNTTSFMIFSTSRQFTSRTIGRSCF